MTGLGAATDEWLAALRLERLTPAMFRGFAPPGRRRRVFGGMAMGQALVAAASAVASDRQTPLSVHCEFVRAGDPQRPIDFATTATSAGRRFATCTVQARQAERLLFSMLARFHAGDAGPEFQVGAPADAPVPDSLADYPTHLAPDAARVPDWAAGHSPIDVRMIDERGTTGQRSWIRIGDGSTRQRLPSDELGVPVVGACGLLYAGDMTLLGTAPMPFGLLWSDEGVSVASLDHAMWFHRRFDVDEWLLYEQQVVSVAGSRALARGEMYAADGRLVATVMQNGLLDLAGAES